MRLTLRAVLCLVACLAAIPAFPTAPSALAADAQGTSRFVVADDGNNLRASGGSDYRKAAVIAVLNRGDMVTVLSRQGNGPTCAPRTAAPDGSTRRACAPRPPT
jgi:uncharacterized protein YgiM (DUF1202 family)